MRLNGKIAIVTGAGSGIGRAMVVDGGLSASHPFSRLAYGATAT